MVTELWQIISERARRFGVEANDATAIQHFQHVLRADPNHQGAIDALEKLARERRDNVLLADMLARRAATVTPGGDRVALYVEIAELERKAGRNDAAMAALAKAANDAPGDVRVLGPLAGRAAPGLYLDAKFRDGVKTLARMGFSFDCWLYHPQMDDLTALADAIPECRIVLNHCGGIVGINAYKRDEVFPVWKKSLQALAKRPNVYVKLGGLGMRLCGHAFDQLAEPPSSQMLADSWRPYIETCIAAFGPNRGMFEQGYEAWGS